MIRARVPPPSFRLDRLFLALLVGLVAACDGRPDWPESGSTDGTRHRVTGVILPYISAAPLHLADAEGFFAEAGVEVRWIEATSAQPYLPALDSGEIDFLPATLDPAVLNTISRGRRVRAVAERARLDASRCDFQAIAVRRALVETGEVGPVSDLAGRRVRVGGRALSRWIVGRMLEAGGTTLEDLQDFPMPAAAAIAAMERGDLDAAFLGDPLLTRAVQQGVALPIAGSGAVLDGFPYGLLLFGPRLLRDEPELGRSLLRAVARGVEQYLEGKTERNVGILADRTGLPAELLRASCWPTASTTGERLRASAGLVADYQSELLALGLVDAILEPGELWWP